MILKEKLKIIFLFILLILPFFGIYSGSYLYKNGYIIEGILNYMFSLYFLFVFGLYILLLIYEHGINEDKKIIRNKRKNCDDKNQKKSFEEF